MAAHKTKDAQHKVLVIGLALLLLVLLASAWTGYLWSAYQSKPLPIFSHKTVVIRSGESLSRFAHRLEQLGVLNSANTWLFLAKIRDLDTHAKAGEYQLNPGITTSGLLNLVVSGKTLKYKITLVEGWTFQQIRQALDRHPHLLHQTTALSEQEIMQLLKEGNRAAEGLFAADTYLFPHNAVDISVLKQARELLRSRLTQAWRNQAADLPLQTPYEALILASILEKETAINTEYPLIAGVFIRRLNKGMRLQTDPSVIYGLGKKFKGNLTRKHLRSDTAYNTYTRKGLPPTPIATTGQAALKAAVQPAPGTSLYFVARGDGTHQFSDNLKEHWRAVRKFQLKK